MPTSADDAVIKTAANQPSIVAGTAIVRDIELQSGTTLTMTGGALDVNRDWINNNGSLTASGGQFRLFTGRTPKT